RTLVTPVPTSRTMPVPSCPSTSGVFAGQSPRAGCRSLWHTPAAFTSTSTSPACGASSSAASITSGRPCSHKIAALICIKVVIALGHSQNHLAVAGGYAVGSKLRNAALAPTRYREVVLTVSKLSLDQRQFRCHVREQLDALIKRGETSVVGLATMIAIEDLL